MIFEAYHRGLDIALHLQYGDDLAPFCLDAMPPFENSQSVIASLRLYQSALDSLPQPRKFQPHASQLLRQTEYLERMFRAKHPQPMPGLHGMWDRATEDPIFRRCIFEVSYGETLHRASRYCEALQETPPPMLHVALWDAALQHGLDANAVNGLPQIWGRACRRTKTPPKIALWYFIAERERALNGSPVAARSRALFWRSYFGTKDFDLEMPLSDILALYAPPKKGKAR